MPEKITINQLKKRFSFLKEEYPELTPIYDTYVSYTKKMKFIDEKYGKWEAIVGNVLNGHGHPKGMVERQIKTCRKKYGKDFAIQTFEVFKKSEMSCWQSHILYHWKTLQPLNVRGSFQWAVVDKLNKEKIDFNWQIPFNIEINNKERV